MTAFNLGMSLRICFPWSALANIMRKGPVFEIKVDAEWRARLGIKDWISTRRKIPLFWTRSLVIHLLQPMTKISARKWQRTRAISLREAGKRRPQWSGDLRGWECEGFANMSKRLDWKGIESVCIIHYWFQDGLTSPEKKRPVKNDRPFLLKSYSVGSNYFDIHCIKSFFSFS